MSGIEEGLAEQEADIAADANSESGQGSTYDDEIDAAKAAVSKAVKAAEKEEATEGQVPKPKPAAKPKAKPAAPKPEPTEAKGETEPKVEPEDDEDVYHVKNVLSQRKAMAAKKAEFNEEQALARRELEGLYEQIQAEKRHIDEQRRIMSDYKKDPARAVREAGLDPEEFIRHLAREGTPEGRQEREMMELRAEIQEQNRRWEQQEQQRQQQEQEAQQRYAVQYRQNVEQEFLSHVNNEELRPLTKAFYEGREDELVAAADILAMRYRQKSRGREAPLDQLADWIEESVAERFQKMYESRVASQAQANGSAPSKEVGQPPLSPTAASERRSFGKPEQDLDGEELVQLAKQQAAAAIAEYRRMNPDADDY